MGPEDLISLTQPSQIPESAAQALGGIGLGDTKAEILDAPSHNIDPGLTDINLNSLRSVLYQNPKAELNKEQLRVLYEIDGWLEERTEDYGTKDPMIDYLTAPRDIKTDIAKALGVKNEQVAMSKKEWSPGSTVYLRSNLVLGSPNSNKFLSLPRYIYGHVGIHNITSPKDIEMPERIWGHLAIDATESIQGLKLPEWVGCDLKLEALKSAEGLKLPDYIGRCLQFDSLESVKGLELPKHIGSALCLDNLVSSEGLVDLLRSYKGAVYLPKKFEPEINKIVKNNPNISVTVPLYA